MGDHARAGALRHETGRASEDLLGRLGRRGPAPVTLLVGAADHDGALARDDVRRTSRVEPPVVQGDAVHHDDLAAHRMDVEVARQPTGAEPRAVDHDTVLG